MPLSRCCPLLLQPGFSFSHTSWNFSSHVCEVKTDSSSLTGSNMERGYHTDTHKQSPPICPIGCSVCNLSTAYIAISRSSLCFCACPCMCVQVNFHVYDRIHQCPSVPLCLLQEGPRSSYYAQESSASNAHVKAWVSMMHQRAIQISFHPPRASSPLFIWLLGCSVNDISSTITLKCVQDTDTPPFSLPHKVQGLAFLAWNVFIILVMQLRRFKYPI